MSYCEAQNILDARRAGKDMPESVVLQALEMTGDYTWELSRREAVGSNDGLGFTGGEQTKDEDG